MIKDSNFARFLLALLLSTSLLQTSLADSVNPSARTRTLSVPKDNYFQEISDGHPYRWFDRDMALKVLIKPGTSVPQFRPQFTEILTGAFHEWEKISNSKLSFQFVSDSPADITCQFVENLPDQKPEVAGVTSYQTSPFHVQSALISLRTHSGVAPITDELMYSICLHEIGHALGLVRHNTDPHDVMYHF